MVIVTVPSSNPIADAHAFPNCVSYIDPHGNLLIIHAEQNCVTAGFAPGEWSSFSMEPENFDFSDFEDISEKARDRSEKPH